MTEPAVSQASPMRISEFEQFADIVLVIDNEDICGAGPVAAFDLGHGCWLAVRMKSARGRPIRA